MLGSFTYHNPTKLIFGTDAMEAWMREIGCVMSISELGATEDMIEDIADSTLVMQGGYHVLTRDEIVAVLRASL